MYECHRGQAPQSSTCSGTARNGDAYSEDVIQDLRWQVTTLQQQLTNSGDEEGTDRKGKTGDAPGPAGPAAQQHRLTGRLPSLPHLIVWPD